VNKSMFPFGVKGQVALVFMIIFLGMTLYLANITLFRDVDVGFHVRIGERILAEKEVPKTAIFSEHEGKIPWVDHAWFTQILMASVYKMKGLTGISLMYSLIIALTYALLAKWAMETDVHPFGYFVILILSILVGIMYWSARPQQFSVLFLVIFHRIMILYDREESKWVYILPLLMCIWANCHAGFLTGFLIIGAYGAAYLYEFYLLKKEGFYKKRFIYITLLLALCFAASCINPYGWNVYSTIKSVMGDKIVTETIREYSSVDFHELFFMSFLCMMLFSIALFMMSSVKSSVPEIIITVGFTYLALKYNRYILFYGVVMVPILFKHISDVLPWKKEYSLPGSPKIWATALLCSLIFVFTSAWGGWIKNDWDHTKVPIDAVRYIIKEDIPGRFLNLEAYASVITYHSNKYKPFYDGRSDVYGGELWNDYIAIIGIEDGWDKLLEDKYKFNWVFYCNNMPLTNALAKMPDRWVRIYSDKLVEIYVRNTPENAEFLKNHPPVERTHNRKINWLLFR